MSSSIIPGAEPWSHAGGPVGVLCVHGFTGNPSSMRGVAEACAAAGYSVELPLLPGHGTAVGDMLDTGWADWTAEADAAYSRLSARTDEVVVAGLSMGGSLTLWLGAQHPEVKGLVCINPATQPQPPEIVEMIHDFIAQGMDVMPGIGSDIADPDATETAYDGTPLKPLLSLVGGLAELAPDYPTLQMPLLLMHSPQDHVVDPVQADYLAEHYGGVVKRLILERSYHVATLDYDRELVEASAVAFVAQVTS